MDDPWKTWFCVLLVAVIACLAGIIMGVSAKEDGIRADIDDKTFVICVRLQERGSVEAYPECREFLK